ncbi:hypothetical protein ES708_21598 [subsurface metagenome]
MNYNILGKTKLKVSEIGFGGIQITRIPENQAINLICVPKEYLTLFFIIKLLFANQKMIEFFTRSHQHYIGGKLFKIQTLSV